MNEGFANYKGDVGVGVETTQAEKGLQNSSEIVNDEIGLEKRVEGVHVKCL